MSEKQKAIYLEEWLIESIKREAEKHHRSWMREVQAILEEKVLEKRAAEEPVETKYLSEILLPSLCYTAPHSAARLQPIAVASHQPCASLPLDRAPHAACNMSAGCQLCVYIRDTYRDMPSYSLL